MSPYSKITTTLTQRDDQTRLKKIPTKNFCEAPDFELGLQYLVRVDPCVRYQNIEGFGGAFTEAAATTLLKLPSEKQEEVISSYFHPEKGNQYNLCRTHINSCDFALGCYAYCETDGDFDLENFSIERDRQALLPMIKRAQALVGADLKLLASPWSPPAWMKTTGKMKEGGELRPECREVWAKYYVRYISEYEKEGVPIWAISVQNEPEAKQTWDSCIYTAEQERDFVRDYLGPTLAASDFPDTRIVIWDHNRDCLFDRAKVVYDDPKAAAYVWGSGFHWYVGDNFENVQLHYDAWPDKKLLFTEGCQERGPHLGEWPLGERYARSIIQDLNHGTVGWIDWNLLLDTQGGPNHVGNFCSAPILADVETGELHYQSSYYYLAHFSRFIKRDARRILSSSTRDELETLACENPDGSLAIVVMNRSEINMAFTLKVEGQYAKLEAPARSIQTIELER